MNGKLAIHLVWGGVVMTCCGQLCWTALALAGDDSLRTAAPALLAIAGPATGAAGVILSRLGKPTPPR
jgi:hypothetical protein